MCLHLPGVGEEIGIERRRLRRGERDVGQETLEMVRLGDEFGPGECRNYFHSCGYSNARSNREPLIP